MNDRTIDHLDEILSIEQATKPFEMGEVPDVLLDSPYIEIVFRPPTRCKAIKSCNSSTDYEIEDGQIHQFCDEGHSTRLPVKDYEFIQVDFESLLQGIVEHLQFDLDHIQLENLPKFAEVMTEEDFRIFLILSPHDYRATINEILVQTLIEDSPALIITPDDSIEDILEIQALFATGNLVYTVQFTSLKNEEEILQSLETIQDIREFEEEFVHSLEDVHPVVNRVNSNPRYILTELNHMRLLRISGELPNYSGTRLEKIAESVLSHIFVTLPDRGGEDDRGGNYPDYLFYISDRQIPNQNDSILGIVDTKSGADAALSSEAIEGKHLEYLERGRRQAIDSDLIAHCFVILDFEGHQEISFYDDMEEYYKNNEYLIIFTADALATMMSAYLAYTVSNELSLREGDFQTAVYPLFHKELFADLELYQNVREVDQDREAYTEKYLSRPGLLVVTRDVVLDRLRSEVENPGEIERKLESYFQPIR